MKKFALLLVSFLAISVAALATEKGAFTMQKVDGPTAEPVMAFARTYSYPAEDIENAILERFKNEGLSCKKAKNKFYAYMGVKYNSLWNRTLDIYFSVNGSKKSGVVLLVLSTGYNNFISNNDSLENQKIAEWMISLEENIKLYIYNLNVEEQQKLTDEASKEVKKLKADKEKAEKKIEANNNAIKAFEEKRTIVDSENVSTIDPKILEKEQKQYDKFMDKKNKLQYELDEIDAKLDKAKRDFNEKNDDLKKLKSNRP